MAKKPKKGAIRKAADAISEGATKFSKAYADMTKHDQPRKPRKPRKSAPSMAPKTRRSSRYGSTWIP